MPEVRLHTATLDDVETIAALAVQVYLDTYATGGIFPALANEALSLAHIPRFQQQLAESTHQFTLAKIGPALVGFAALELTPLPSPNGEIRGAELERLYILPRFQGTGIGRRLMLAAEQLVREYGGEALWLTVWQGNIRAIGFYEHLGYRVLGVSNHTFGGEAYGNLVLGKVIAP